jgi:phosphoribosylformylglycinamidine synthase
MRVSGVTWGVVTFPGSNDDRDTLYGLGDVLGQRVLALWHATEDIGGCDAIVLPGGFSYGDYLRAGALARFSPIMRAVTRFAREGGPVLGICNGFQILCEAGLLPGALVRNRDLRFICRTVPLAVENTTSAFTCAYRPGQILEIPIKHGEGRYVADATTLAMLAESGRVVLRYAGGAPNGSTAEIAGIANQAGNVVGLMPHPEHAVDAALGRTDGRGIFESVSLWLARSPRSATA